jgi:hypothetical protein
MIFGFNTDVKYADTVYHVQSEVRKHDLLLQTQVFVRGRCIGKRATSYADRADHITEEALHEELKGQHRGIVDAVREGRVDQVLAAPTASGIQPTASGIQPVNAGNGHGSGLDVEWTNADAAYTEGSVVMRFKVTQGGSAVAGAKLTSRLNVANDAPIYSQASTDDGGTAEMRVFVDEAALQDAAVLVQAKVGEQTASKKFLLKRP